MSHDNIGIDNDSRLFLIQPSITKSGSFFIILKLDGQGNPGWPIVSSYGYLREHKLNRIIRIAKGSYYDNKF